MQPKQKASVKKEINQKTQAGDIILLSKILDVGYSTAYSRFFRNDKNAVLVMQKIIKNREQLVNKLIKKYGNGK